MGHYLSLHLFTLSEFVIASTPTSKNIEISIGLFSPKWKIRHFQLLKITILCCQCFSGKTILSSLLLELHYQAHQMKKNKKIWWEIEPSVQKKFTSACVKEVE